MNRKINPIVFPHLQALLRQTAQRNASFTVCELRDQLIERGTLARFERTTLRRYVYDQISKMVRQGLVVCVGLHPGFKHREVFKTTSSAFDVGPNDTINQNAVSTASDNEPLYVKLQRDCDRLREQMTDRDIQIRALQEIAEKYPDARREIASLFEQEQAAANELGEKLRAYAKIQQQLAQGEK